MNNGYNPEQFDENETVGDINQLLSNGRGIVNAGRSAVGGARSAINSGKSTLDKLKKNDEKDVEAINNRQKNNDGVNKKPRNTDENDNKKQQGTRENKTQSSESNASSQNEKSKLSGKENSDNDKSNINDKVDKSKKDDNLNKKANNKKDDGKKKKPKSKNSKSTIEVKKKSKIKLILVAIKVGALIAFPILVIVLVILMITAAIKWAENNLGFFADLIIPDSLKFDIGDYHSNSSYSGKYGFSSSFIVDGKEYSGKIKVRLYKNDQFELVYANDELIDFDKYILGVAYQEAGGGTDSVSEQVFKAQAIAARSYALTRGSGMGGKLSITEENGYVVINIRQTTGDQAYCDPDKGYSVNQVNNCSSGHPALSSNSPLRKWAQEVEGLVLVNSNGEVVYTPYTSDEQNAWRSMAQNGMKYDEILLKQYDSTNKGYTIKKISTTVSNTEAENWKQCDSRWGNLTVRSQTICKIGCALTSVSIQIARSGASTKVSGEFNPGTFMQAHRSNGGFSASDSITWNVSGVAPNFKFISSSELRGTKKEKMQKINDLVSAGEFVVLGVSYTYTKSSNINHYVAVNYVGDDEIYSFDPNSSKKGKIFSDYSAMANSDQPFQLLRYRLE